jgi:hypothetical protein
MADDARLAEIRSRHQGCIDSGDDLCDVPYLLDRLARTEIAPATEARGGEEDS